MEVSQSYLFTIRIWIEESGRPGETWRGQVEHILSGERQYFRDWGTLVKFLQSSAHLVDHLGQGNTEGEAGS
jgi:hypothetical protein